MALSRLWQAREIWREASRGAGVSQNDATYNERFVLINRAVNAVVGQFFDLLSNSYMTNVTAVPSNDARYYTANAGWVASTRTLTATMNTPFASGDVGKLVIFHDGTSGYAGTVESYGSATTVVLEGDNLPASDITLGTIDYVIMLATAPTSDVLDLSSLKLMRYGQQIKLEIQSTVTTTIEAMTIESFRKFRSGATGNLNKIIFAFLGDRLYLDKGDSLASYGTLTLFYPSIPTEVTADTDYLDVPDGPAVEIIMLKTKALVAERIQVPLPDQSKEVETLVRNMYKTFAVEANDELIKSKVSALK